MKTEKLILKLEEAGINDVETVGGKNASLGEMIQHLNKLGVRIPTGFILTVKSYQEFIAYNNLQSKIDQISKNIDVDTIESLRKGGLKIRGLILNGDFPENMIAEIKAAYQVLSAQYHVKDVDVAVRSSATAEDLPDASFAGQQETFLNVSGEEQLLNSIRRCFASLFTDRAISYRKSFGYNHFEIGLSVCIQKMVRSDLAASGVAFSLDTESGFKDVIVINGAFGLGEMVVQGAISPDEFIVFKPTLKQGYAAIIEKKLGVKDKKMVYGTSEEERVKIIDTTPKEQSKFCLSELQVLLLAKWVNIIEYHYSAIKDHWCPMDIEWAVDGESKELFIVQARPETIHSRKETQKIRTYSLIETPQSEDIMLKGIAVGDKIGTGNVKIINSFEHSDIAELDFKQGDVLVTDITDPDWEPLMKIASAIVTNKGGRTCHAAIVARELGIPAIVACQNATEILKEGDLVTISCAEGDVGYVYKGYLPFTAHEFDLSDLPQTQTPIMLNIASPEKAFHYANYPHHGVGLAREEFIINNYIKAHPLALLHHHRLRDKELTRQIKNLTEGFEDGEDYFIKKLAYGIAKIAAASYPKRTIVRFSDFKSNEYYNLLGGSHFEPKEENPMIGWRGAS
ncbi:MAG TPA: phosphoenolpyruvate synthase, partial [Arachidicoccus soli]|nr:phosphoenolpyruvate synthase [Arachidicoccus soli]